MEVFARLDLFAITFSDNAAPYRYNLDDLLKTAPNLHTSPLSSIHQAHASLVDLLRLMLVVGNHIYFRNDALTSARHDFQEELKRCGQKLCEWRYHWRTLLLTCEDPSGLHAKNVELWYSMAITLLHVGFHGPETRYDSAMDHMKRMVELSEDLSSTINQTAETTWFSLDLGFLIPTFFCAIRCREPSIRRRAISVLEHCERREGIWESTAAAAISRRWMQLEEEGLGDVQSAGEIPESKRIVELGTHTKPEQSKIQLSFKHASPSLGTEEPCRQEYLAWRGR